jgi:hypothetical protein
MSHKNPNKHTDRHEDSDNATRRKIITGALGTATSLLIPGCGGGSEHDDQTKQEDQADRPMFSKQAGLPSSGIEEGIYSAEVNIIALLGRPEGNDSPIGRYYVIEVEMRPNTNLNQEVSLYNDGTYVKRLKKITTADAYYGSEKVIYLAPAYLLYKTKSTTENKKFAFKVTYTQPGRRSPVKEITIGGTQEDNFSGTKPPYFHSKNNIAAPSSRTFYFRADNTRASRSNYDTAITVYASDSEEEKEFDALRPNDGYVCYEEFLAWHDFATLSDLDTDWARDNRILFPKFAYDELYRVTPLKTGEHLAKTLVLPSFDRQREKILIGSLEDESVMALKETIRSLRSFRLRRHMLAVAEFIGPKIESPSDETATSATNLFYHELGTLIYGPGKFDHADKVLTRWADKAKSFADEIEKELKKDKKTIDDIIDSVFEMVAPKEMRGIKNGMQKRMMGADNALTKSNHGEPAFQKQPVPIAGTLTLSQQTVIGKVLPWQWVNSVLFKDTEMPFAYQDEWSVRLSYSIVRLGTGYNYKDPNKSSWIEVGSVLTDGHIDFQVVLVSPSQRSRFLGFDCSRSSEFTAIFRYNANGGKNKFEFIEAQGDMDIVGLSWVEATRMAATAKAAFRWFGKMTVWMAGVVTEFVRNKRPGVGHPLSFSAPISLFSSADAQIRAFTRQDNLASALGSRMRRGGYSFLYVASLGLKVLNAIGTGVLSLPLLGALNVAKLVVWAKKECRNKSEHPDSPGTDVMPADHPWLDLLDRQKYFSHDKSIVEISYMRFKALIPSPNQTKIIYAPAVKVMHFTIQGLGEKVSEDVNPYGYNPNKPHLLGRTCIMATMQTFWGSNDGKDQSHP